MTSVENMTSVEKKILADLCKSGQTFKQIRKLVDCSDGTIRQYLKVFAPREAKGE